MTVRAEIRRAARVLLLSAASGATAQGAAAPASADPAAPPGAAAGDSRIVATRRLTESQYRHSVADVFGEDIEINGRFEPERREDLLLAIGSSMLTITPSGFNQYFAMAEGIAEQVFSAERRERFTECPSLDAATANDACAGAFVRSYGRLLFRRPLNEAEVAARVELAGRGAARAEDFYKGQKLALMSLLTAPEFLFRVEQIDRDADTGTWRLDGYSKATRLSYLLWDTAPDEALLRAAADGSLHSAAGLEREVERLLASPRLEHGARAFFTDMLQLDEYESLTKDPQIFPKFSQQVAHAAREQTLKTVVHHLLEREGDYRDLLTTRETFMDRSLAAVFQVPFLAEAGWMPYTYPEDSGRSGLLTQMSLLALFSHPGRSSPTNRGVAINEIYRCEPTPLPPANVDFSIVNDTENPQLPTVRARLLAHSEDPSCAGCHELSDPLGLALERFDSLGQPRLYENGDLIDVSAELDGRQFEGARELGQVLRESEGVTACVVRNVYAYGVGRAPEADEDAYLDARAEAFAAADYRFPALLRQMATTPEFFSFQTPPETDLAPSTVGATSRSRNPAVRAREGAPTGSMAPTGPTAPTGVVEGDS